MGEDEGYRQVNMQSPGLRDEQAGILDSTVNWALVNSNKFIRIWFSYMTNHIYAAGTERKIVVFRLPQTHAITTEFFVGLIIGHRVIFPKADRANIVIPIWFLFKCKYPQHGHLYFFMHASPINVKCSAQRLHSTAFFRASSASRRMARIFSTSTLQTCRS